MNNNIPGDSLFYKYLVIIFIVMYSTSIFCQTPKTKGLMVLSDKFNILYANVENPISINKSFDSLSFKDGEVKYIDNEIYIIPNKPGYKELRLYKGKKLLTYPFHVKEFESRPFIFFQESGHGYFGRIQEKDIIYTHWEIDYSVKLDITEFKVTIEKADGSVITSYNETGLFSEKLKSIFQNLDTGDKLKIYDIKCRFPNGNIIYAEEYEANLKW